MKEVIEFMGFLLALTVISGGIVLVVWFVWSLIRSDARSTTPDIYSPDLDRDLLESVDFKAARLIELLEKEGAPIKCLQEDVLALDDWLDNLGEGLEKLEGRVQVLEEDTDLVPAGPPHEASTCCGEWATTLGMGDGTVACCVAGPLPTSFPIVVRDSEWQEYCQQVGGGECGREGQSHPQPKSPQEGGVHE